MKLPIKHFISLFATTLLLTTIGCAIEDSLSPEDTRAIQHLTKIAPQDSKIKEKVHSVECWKPSDNLVEEKTFRVLCRLHYEQQDTQRYKDMVCIGEIDAQPVTDYCYLWAYYSLMPVFEDQAGYEVSPETLN